MKRLTLHLLGAPEATQNGEPVSGFRSAKARALLFYVAATDQPQPRTKLAGLFWGELPEENANANLRKTLTNLRKVAGAHLAITRETVAVEEANPPWLDVRAFEAAANGEELEGLPAAVALYRGDFLEGFYVQEAPAFERWVRAERHRLREKFLAALKQLAMLEAGRGRRAEAIAHGQRLLALEPLREDAHRLLMALYAENGRRARALAQYEACAEILAQELGVAPDAKTRALFEEIRAGKLAPTAVAAPRHNLPAPTTSFVGREAELAQIARWLRDDRQRLLTVTGSGGVGKTRLAQEAAWQALDDFAHGVWLVPLTSLQDASGLARLVASTLNVSLAGEGRLDEQLMRYLRRKTALLILDNAEHLISGALSDFLMALLTGAPDVKIIVSSRQRLRMQAERVMSLRGLAYAQDGTAGVADAPARQLFWQRTEGHGERLPDTAQTAKAVHRLCQLVEGLPLALELAASWTPAMSLEQIVAAVEHGLDFLQSELRDVPARHRSMQAVFDTSWRLLREEERRIMRQLSTFEGGFSLPEAGEVAGVAEAQLGALVDRSLIRRQRATGSPHRYEMHELIRQYAAEKLAQHPEEAQAVARRHGETFAAFVAAREEAIQGADYLQAKEEIEAEAGNVRKAWEWAVEARSVAHVAASMETLHYYFLNTQGLFGEAAQRFERAAEGIGEETGAEAQRLAGGLLLRAAVNRRMLGQLEEAHRLAEASLSIFLRQELATDIARATSTLSVIRMQQNDGEEALRLAEAAVAQARELSAPVDLCLCLNNLAYVLAQKGQVEEAAAVAEESVRLARENGYAHGELSALNMLGVYYHWLGEGDRAQGIFEELVARCRQAATPSRLAQAVNNLGELYKVQGQADKALPLLREAAQLYEAVGQAHYAASVAVLLGELALQRGDVDEAGRYCGQALQVAQEMEMPALALEAMMLLAQLLSERERVEEAVSVLALAAQHEATPSQSRERVEQLVQPLRDGLAAEDFEAAWERGSAWTVEDAIRARSLSFRG